MEEEEKMKVVDDEGCDRKYGKRINVEKKKEGEVVENGERR